MNQMAAYPDDLTLADPGLPFLLHACCGPCLEYPARAFLAEGRSFTAWFYNPNIQPAFEHARRQAGFFAVTEKLGLPALAESVSQPEKWQNWTGSKNERCLMCYSERLGQAAQKTAQLGLTAFTTTLLISPWQDQAAIRAVGRALAARYKVSFLYRDLRPFYRAGQALAREDQLYRQKYCGCLPSIADSKFKDKIIQELEDNQAWP